MRILRIHNVTVAVGDVDEARATFGRLFGTAGGDPAPLPAFGVRTADVALGDGALRLASPEGADNPLTRFLQRRGEGFYNVALEVDDLDAAVAELSAQGVAVSEPVEAEPGVRSAFVAMASTHGLSIQLVELLQPPPDDAAPADEDVLPEDEAPADDAEPEQRPLDLTPDEWSDVD
ncbi:MAG: VOC family protein [Dehalococcoidia bacterium]